MIRIWEQEMKCQKCDWVGPLDNCIGDVDGDGSLGCPITDCGGIALATEIGKKYEGDEECTGSDFSFS